MYAHMDQTRIFKQEVDSIEIDHTVKIEEHEIKLEHGSIVHSNLEVYDKNYLTIHQIEHTREIPFKCIHCTKVFSLKKDLVNHLRAHNAGKSFKCIHTNVMRTPKVFQTSRLHYYVRDIYKMRIVFS